jgi:hypothetical protein
MDERCNRTGCTRRAAFEGLCVVHDAEEVFGIPFDELIDGRTDHRLQPLFESLDTETILSCLSESGEPSSRHALARLDPELEAYLEAAERLPLRSQQTLVQIFGVYFLRILLRGEKPEAAN